MCQPDWQKQIGLGLLEFYSAAQWLLKTVVSNISDVSHACVNF